MADVRWPVHAKNYVREQFDVRDLARARCHPLQGVTMYNYKVRIIFLCFMVVFIFHGSFMLPVSVIIIEACYCATFCWFR